MKEDGEITIKKLLFFAIQNQKKANFKNAKNAYEKIIKLNPDIISAHYNLGLVLTKLGENEKAIRCYEQVIRKNPQVADAHNNLGLIYYKLGDTKKALNYYENAIKINPNYSNAFNNIGLVYANKGQYEQAIENYNKALIFNNKHKDANKNLISAVTFYKSNNKNPIVTTNNSLKKIFNEITIENFCKKETLKKLFKKSKETLSSIENKFNFLENQETQTYRRNSVNLNCERHHAVFNEFNIIPKNCFNCYKIQIEPISVVDLIKLFFIFDNFKFPKNNWRKCMVELREGVPGTYKGFIYCSSTEEANQILNELEPIINKFLKFNLKLKRGCTEFYSSYPEFNEIDKDKLNFMNYNSEWEKIEKKYDSKKNTNKKKLIDSISGITILDYLIISNWLNFAKNINDLSYKDISEDFYYSSFIYTKLSEQIEFRKNQLIC